MEEKVQAIIDLLKQRYPESQCALHYNKTNYEEVRIWKLPNVWRESLPL